MSDPEGQRVMADLEELKAYDMEEIDDSFCIFLEDKLDLDEPHENQIALVGYQQLKKC